MTAPLPASGPLLRRVLDNGLTCLILREPAQPIATLQAWVRAGSVTEGRWLGAGISHYVEHMLFKGTPTRAVGQFAREIAAAGGHCNAYTHTERTVYHVHVQRDAVPAALDALADVLQHASFDAAEAAREREVILRELEDGLENPPRRLYHLFQRAAWRFHPARYPIIGLRDRFAALTRDDLAQYHDGHYRPDRTVLLAVGDVDPTRLVDQMQHAFGGWPSRPAALDPIPAEPLQVARRETSEEFRVKDTRLLLGWHTVPVTHPDSVPLDLLAAVLGHGRTSRLVRELRNRRGLVHSITTSASGGLQPGNFLVSATAAPEREAAATAAVLQEIAQARQEPVSAAELDRAVVQLRAGAIQGRESIENLASVLGTGEFTYGDPAFDRRYLEEIGQVTPGDLLRVARLYLDDSNLTVAALRPTRPVAADAPAPVRSSSPATRGHDAVKRDVLPGGATLLTMMRPRLPITSAVAVLPGGVRQETAGTNGVSQLVAHLLTRGTRQRSADQLADEVESLGASLDGLSGRNTWGISASCLCEHLDRILPLLGEALREPAFPEERFEQARREARARIRARRERPMEANGLQFHAALYGDHPCGRPGTGTEESIAALTRADCAAFHLRMLHSQRLVLGVVGDVEADRVRDRIARIVAAVPALVAPPAEPPPVAPVRGPIRVVQDLGHPALTAVTLGYLTVDLRHPDAHALEVLQQALSAMGGRLFTRLRDELALAYQVGCSSVTPIDRGAFAFHILTRPDQVTQALAEMRAQIAGLAREGLSADEVAHAKASLLEDHYSSLQTNGSLAMSMALAEVHGQGWEYPFRYPERLAEVTRDDLQRVAAQYFLASGEVLAITGREA